MQITRDRLHEERKETPHPQNLFFRKIDLWPTYPHTMDAVDDTSIAPVLARKRA
jgi:hypothetical protein